MNFFDKVFLHYARKGKLNWMSDERYLKKKYHAVFGKKLDLKNPQTFNEKMQWLKLYDRKPVYTTMVDKYEAKKFAASIIGEKYIIPTLGVWDSFDEIDFNTLPEKFVLKTTHDCGGIVICTDKKSFDLQSAKEKINKHLKRQYFYWGREWPYKDVKPRIIAEKYLEPDSSGEICDYKFMCFNGKLKCVFTCTDRFFDDGLKVTFFDIDWNKMDFTRHYPRDEKNIACPLSFKKMIELAEVLAAGIAFVRIDFYEVDEKPYLGEITFFPGSGFEEFSPSQWDKTLGDWIVLPSSN